MSRCFVIDLWEIYADGRQSELMTIDLVGSRGEQRVRRLKKLDDAMLIFAEPIRGWPMGDDGKWIRAPLGSDTVFGQWRRDVPVAWRKTSHRFMVMRVLAPDEVRAFLTSVPPAGVSRGDKAGR